MNYLKQLNAFYSYLESELLSPNEISLYHGLLYSNNRCGWLSEFKVSNNVLLSRSGLSKTSLNRARNRLIQLELISFVKGKNKYSAGSYQMIKLYDVEVASHIGTVNDTVNAQNRVASHIGTVNDTVECTVTEPIAEPLLNINKTNSNNIYTGDKNMYHDFVLLTDDEYQKLIDQYNKLLVDDFILRLNNYIGQIDIVEATKKYRNHYFTLKIWIDKHIKDKKDSSKNNTIPFRKKQSSNGPERQYDYEELERKALELRLAESNSYSQKGGAHIAGQEM